MDPNYRLVQEDLETTQHVDFLVMLKAMIMMKRVREDTNDTKGAPADESLEVYSRVEVMHLVKVATDFCDDPTRSQKAKDRLTEALKAREDFVRQEHLVSAFNAILLDFKNRDVGSLGRCPAEDQALYTVNHPFDIESKRLSAIVEDSTRCKPDICEIPLEKLLTVVQPGELNDESLEGFANFMETRPGDWQNARKRSGLSESRLTWSDVIHCIEVKVGNSTARGTRLQRFDEPYTIAGIISPDSLATDMRTNANGPAPKGESSSGGSVPLTPLQSRSQKRTAAWSPDAQPTKRTKSEFIHSEVPRFLDQNRPLDPEVQCAFYGIELLRATWDKTHSFVTMLSGDNFSLHWYDSQGQISTYTVNIVEQLPLLVALVILLQRFKKPMRGTANVELETTLDGEHVTFGIPASVKNRWELKGRRPIACIPVPANPKPPHFGEPRPELVKLMNGHFFKWSWREHTWDSEANIVAIARERALQFLGDHKNDVINHLPDVKYSRDYPLLSTGLIRQYAGLDASRARIPSVMVSSKLSDAQSLDGDAIRVKIWEIIRCIFLLWRLGIAHSDMSLGNIMVNETKEGGPYMVLNDFDLATVMTPGDKTFQKKGFERTGTMPFMAVELLKPPFGAVKRTCRHDLESILWVLVWLCRKDPTWCHGTHESVANSKGSFSFWCTPSQMPHDIQEKNKVLWLPVVKATRAWMSRWSSASLDEELDTLSEYDILDDIRKAFPCPKEYEQWDWPNFRAAT